MAKTALAEAGLKAGDYLLIELDKRSDGDAIQDALNEITGGRTVGIPFFIDLPYLKAYFQLVNFYWPSFYSNLRENTSSHHETNYSEESLRWPITVFKYLYLIQGPRRGRG